MMKIEKSINLIPTLQGVIYSRVWDWLASRPMSITSYLESRGVYRDADAIEAIADDVVADWYGDGLAAWLNAPVSLIDEALHLFIDERPDLSE